MIISMYSFNQFPLELRKSFELPAWPRSDNPAAIKAFSDYMKSLTVFRYDDDDFNGKKLYGPVNFKVNNDLSDGFVAFYNRVYVDNTEFKAQKWPANDPDGNAMLAKIDSHPILKDRMGWFSWNLPVNVLEWDDNLIKRVVLDEYVESLTESKGCFKKDPNTMTPTERRAMRDSEKP